MIKELRQLVSLSARWRPRPDPGLLLPIQTLVTARHLLPLAHLAADRSIAVYYALSPNLRSDAVRRQICALFAPYARQISSHAAHARRWTLVVVADHGHFHSLLPSGSPVAHIGHGNPSKLGGRRRGLPWEYGQAPRRRNGTLRYREMIESSDQVRDALEREDPALRGRIRVLGRLLDDELLLAARDRESGRQALGFRGERPVLMVASSIGAQSLFARHWQALCGQLEALADRYQVVLCPHPNEHATWQARHRVDSRLRLLEPQLSSEQVLAVADLLLCDHSSLCHKAALLEVPMLFVRCEQLPVWPQGATARLYAAWPQWDGDEPLAPLLTQAIALRGQPSTQVSKQWINSRPGQAHALYDAWLRGYFP